MPSQIHAPGRSWHRCPRSSERSSHSLGPPCADQRSQPWRRAGLRVKGAGILSERYRGKYSQVWAHANAQCAAFSSAINKGTRTPPSTEVPGLAPLTLPGNSTLHTLPHKHQSQRTQLPGDLKADARSTARHKRNLALQDVRPEWGGHRVLGEQALQAKCARTKCLLKLPEFSSQVMRWGLKSRHACAVG